MALDMVPYTVFIIHALISLLWILSESSRRSRFCIIFSIAL